MIQQIVDSWWVVLFFFIAYLVSLAAFSERNAHIKKLHAQVFDLENQKKNALDLYKSLSNQIESEQDPRWIELILIKKLGLVPEGQIKVRFKKDAEFPLYFEGV